MTTSYNPKTNPNVWFNGTNPSTATIFSNTSPPTVDNTALKQVQQNDYIGTDGSRWVWNGTAYVSAPAATAWELSGTSTDAGNTKLGAIKRAGKVGVGVTSPRASLEVANGASQTAITPLNTAITNELSMLTDNGNVGAVKGIFNNGAGSFQSYVQSRNMAASSLSYPYLLNPLGGNVGVGGVNPLSGLDTFGSFGKNLGLITTTSTIGDTASSIVIPPSVVTTQTLTMPAVVNRRVVTITNKSAAPQLVSGNIDSIVGSIPVAPNKYVVLQGDSVTGTWWIAQAGSTISSNGASATKLAAQTIPANIHTSVVWDSITQDPLGMMTAGSAVITPKRLGTYLITAHVRLTSAANAQMIIAKLGVTANNSFTSSINTGSTGVSTSRIVQVTNVADTFAVQIYSSVANPIIITTTTGNASTVVIQAI